MIPAAAEPSPACSALIIDDEAHARTYLRLSLQALGVGAIWETGDASEGVDLYERHRPSFVLLDVNLRSESGVEVIARLRWMDPEAIVIVVTSECAHETVKNFVQLGAAGYVLKHGEPAKFRQALYDSIMAVGDSAET